MICVAIVNCAPQGYDYHHNQQQHGLPVHGLPQISSQITPPITTSNFGSNLLANNPISTHIPSDHHSFFQQAVPQIGNFQNVPSIQQFSSHPQQQHVAPIVTKDIFIHAAPEEPEEQYSQPQLPSQPPRKHYRIVFIKAPTQNIKQQSIRLSQAPTEEKTIIYVLSKKDDPIDIQAALQEIQPTQPSKPEVYFIKYKTQEEAQHAQRQIQGKFAIKFLKFLNLL